MQGLDDLFRYHNFSDLQRSQIEALGALYPEWNDKINVISRRDIDNLYINHVLHSLAIATFMGEVAPGTTFMDLGTGGGFPGIPLAIAYPEARFHLVDRIGKKLRVAADIAEKIGLRNVTFQHGDSGECRERFDYVVSRAVMPLDQLVKAAVHCVAPGRQPDNKYDNGIICLKGGDIDAESRGVQFPVIEFPISEFYTEPFFETKKLIYVPVAATKKKH